MGLVGFLVLLGFCLNPGISTRLASIMGFAGAVFD